MTYYTIIKLPSSPVEGRFDADEAYNFLVNIIKTEDVADVLPFNNKGRNILRLKHNNGSKQYIEIIKHSNKLES